MVLTVLALTFLLFPPQKQAGDLEVRVEKTVEISSSYRYCWYPTVHKFPSGQLMVGIRMSPDEWHPEGDFSAYCLSKDGGLTWSQRYTMGAGANVDGAYTRYPRKDGTVLHLWDWVEADPEGQAKQFRTTLTRYLREGLEIHQIRDARLRFAEPAAMAPAKLFDLGIKDASKLEKIPDVWVFGAILPALNGDLLTTVYCKLERDKYYRLTLFHSTDDARTWNEYSTIAEPNGNPWPGMGREGATEAGMVRLADGRLYIIFRTGGDGLMAHAWSSDDGKTWTPPVSTRFKGVAPRIRRLSNGALACTYGRPGPVTVMFSVDGTGEKWSQVTELFPDMSTRYTDLMEIEPGKLLVVYDSVPYGWHQIPYSDKKSKNTIYGTFVEVRKK